MKNTKLLNESFKKLAYFKNKKGKLNEDISLDDLNLSQQDINEILKGYLDAALWTEEEELQDQLRDINNTDFPDYDDDDNEGDEWKKDVMSIDTFTTDDLEPNSKIEAYLDIKNFLSKAGSIAVNEAVEDNGYERLGMDIWFSRNGHGSGFFDHSYDRDNEKKLTQAAQSLGSMRIFVNDNMLLQFEKG